MAVARKKKPSPDPIVGMDLIERLLTHQADQQREQLAAITVMANAMRESSKAIARWLALFQTNSTPTSHTVRDEDEWQSEIDRLPPELKLAFELQQNPE